MDWSPSITLSGEEGFVTPKTCQRIQKRLERSINSFEMIKELIFLFFDSEMEQHFVERNKLHSSTNFLPEHWFSPGHRISTNVDQRPQRTAAHCSAQRRVEFSWFCRAPYGAAEGPPRTVQRNATFFRASFFWIIQLLTTVDLEETRR